MRIQDKVGRMGTGGEVFADSAFGQLFVTVGAIALGLLLRCHGKLLKEPN